MKQRPDNLLARHAIPLTGLALFGLALAVRLYRLDAQSLWLDEGSSWQLARAPWGALLADMLRPNAAYPLYHLLLKAWVALFGDGEAALRMPSALAGAAAVAAVYAAGVELARLAGAGDRGQGARVGVAAALITLAAPYTIWYAQEAKVYSLLLLCAALAAWALARALRTGERRDWLLLAGVCAVGLFVHRLAALLIVAALWAAARDWLARPGRPAWGPALLLAPALAGGLLVWAMVGGLGGEQAAGRSTAGAAIPAGPPLALWLTFSRFSLDRWPGDAPWLWLLPWGLLLALGLALALADLRGPRRRAAGLALALLLVPLGLFLAQLLFTRLYEARYLTVIYPAWALLLAWPLAGDGGARGRGAARLPSSLIVLRSSLALLAAALLTGGLALFQPTFGIFSGDPVKEQYREAIGELAARAHPDDAVVIHPSYIRPLYDYYMGRLSSDPAPEPIGFADFWQGETDFGQREWDIERRRSLSGRLRSFLLIAPDHARTVDRPRAGDEYGLVGNFWAFSREQGTWPCGIWRYNGAHLLCQESPEAYYTGAVPRPASPSGALFGGNLTLLGYTLKATTPAGPGVYRAGGVLPISLFWDVGAPPAEEYSLFLHLCQDCEAPPPASEDGPPLEGYLPTSTWLPGHPARDDRAIALPRDLPPGRYTLLLGLFRPADPTPAGRLEVTGPGAIAGGRLVLGSVEIVAPEAALPAAEAP